uniref:Uncharacterized protein n=1 Tax=Timema poppense TaxID=170557 RepID=A0A7R9DJ86_TIMPO|nr:unnamed protein product [Timema poppensis]
MSPKVLKQASLQRAMYRMDPPQRVTLLKTAENKLIDSVCECAYNTLNRRVLCKMVKRGECWKKKRRLLFQKGGALFPFLLAPLISGVLGSLFNKELMEHKKKKILVSPLTLHRYEQHHQQVSSATNLVVSKLDKEMEKILASKLDDKFKWTLYQQVLQRYLHFIQHPPPSENTTTSPEVSVLPIPAVLNTVAAQPRGISWDSNGEVSIQDTPLRVSNIVDLVNDLVRARRHSEPSGLREFLTALQKINVPKEFISEDDAVERRNM